MGEALVSDASNTVAAGPFGAWLAAFRASLHGKGGTDVPCGDCDGCCVSSYSILVRPEDKQALSAIPAGLLANAPSLGPGIKAMGYLPNGKCPMLSAGKCSIYAARPQTCRDYDCRIFAAAGIEAGVDKLVINRRVRAWRFTYPTDADRVAHNAVLAAALFIRENKLSFPGGRAPTAPSGIAVLAIKSYAVFLAEAVTEESALDTAAAIIKASREFDTAVGV
jgi:Fe-S-cluster containining protein